MDEQKRPADDPGPEEVPTRRVAETAAAAAGNARDDESSLEYWYFCDEGSLLWLR